MTARFEVLPILIPRVVDNACTARELNMLIHLCIDMSAAVVRSRFQRKLVILERAGYTLEDCAALAVEELFIPRSGIQAAEFVRFFRGELDAGTCDSAGECVIALRRLMYQKVHQTLITITGEADPQYRKILRNIHEAVVRPESGLATRPFFNDTLIHRSAARDSLHLHRPDMPCETLCALLCARADTTASASELIKLLLAEAEASDEYRAALSQAELAAAMRDFFVLRVHRDAVPTTHTPTDTMHFEVRDAIARVLARMKESMLRKSGNRDGKSDTEIFPLLDAIRDFLEDLAEQTPRPLFEYYQAHHPSASYKLYRSNGRMHFEYIMHKAKTDFLDESSFLVKS